MKPTKIIKKPYYPTGRKCDGIAYECDNGQIYTAKELAKYLGIKAPSLSERISKHGWQSDKILQKIGTKEYQPSPLKPITRSGIFAKLGAKPRNKKLLKIPGPTAFELKL